MQMGLKEDSVITDRLSCLRYSLLGLRDERIYSFMLFGLIEG